MKKDLDSARDYRARNFQTKIELDTHYDKQYDLERMHVLSMTSNGHQWYTLGFYKEELDIVIKLLQEYRAKL